jgi:hypothetical protein
MATNISAAMVVATGASEVEFYGDRIPVGYDESGRPSFDIQTASENMGLDGDAQIARVKRAAADGEAWATTSKMKVVGKDGKLRERVSLPNRSAGMFLVGVTLRKVTDPEMREKILRYKNEAAEALADWSLSGGTHAIVKTSDVFAELLESNREMLERTEVIGTRLRLMPTTEYLDGALEQKADKADVDAVAAQLRAEMDALREQFRRHDIETKGRRQPSRDAVRESLRVLLRFYGGLDPVDRTTRVANPDGTRAPGAVWDHNLDRSDPSAEHGWMTCEATNALLKEPGSPEREKFKAVFDEYQRLRRKAADEKTAAQLSLCLKPR